MSNVHTVRDGRGFDKELIKLERLRQKEADAKAARLAQEEKVLAFGSIADSIGPGTQHWCGVKKVVTIEVEVTRKPDEPALRAKLPSDIAPMLLVPDWKFSQAAYNGIVTSLQAQAATNASAKAKLGRIVDAVKKHVTEVRSKPYLKVRDT